jgi:excisionase family DNA binding protein
MSTHRPTKHGSRKIQDLHVHPEPYVTTSELAEYWLVSRKQIYKQIEAGTIKAIRLGPRLLRISTAEALHFEQMAKMWNQGHEMPERTTAPDEGVPPAAAAPPRRKLPRRRRRPRHK